jgi:hypothetical protein
MATCTPVSDVQMLEFIEFLVTQKRFKEAARELEFVHPETLVTRHAAERIALFLPSKTEAA